MTRTLESQRAVNSEQLAQRVKMGDHLEAEREVEHFALFGGRKPALAASVQLSDGGFEVDIVRKGWSRFELHARHFTSIETSEVDEFVCRVFAAIEKNGGTYDGWGGPLVAASV